ncbi:TD and POZ domain-containing protein 4 [Microplitis demolitor]|uniref:TD and POZ domain-containing protein 4 n=1 Tax=Microplitis demolitor TaxID=69319 RepID=UPI0004CDA39C|nr:TD and POZ domain-containing protein 4 [Microplitis demolitor]
MNFVYSKTNKIKCRWEIPSNNNYRSEKNYFIKPLNYCLITVVMDYEPSNSDVIIEVNREYKIVPGTVAVEVYSNNKIKYSEIIDHWFENSLNVFVPNCRNSIDSIDSSSEDSAAMLDDSHDNNYIRIKCEITWLGCTSDDCLSCPLISNYLNNDKEDDWKIFYLDRTLSDVVLIIDEEEIPAHKFVLAAHSPVFLAMFQSNMKEARENSITIENIEIDVMKEVLKFMYTGETSAEDNYELALKLLDVTDRYQIIKLKNFCESTIFRYLSLNNAIYIAIEAEKHNADTLREMAIKFIVKNIDTIVLLNDYKQLGSSHPGLMSEIINLLK